jgi:hypothetical protein
VLTVTVYDWETRTTLYTQLWAWVGPFDDAQHTLDAVLGAVRNGGLNRLEVLETRQATHATASPSWHQPALFDMPG